MSNQRWTVSKFFSCLSKKSCMFHVLCFTPLTRLRFFPCLSPHMDAFSFWSIRIFSSIPQRVIFTSTNRLCFGTLNPFYSSAAWCSGAGARSRPKAKAKGRGHAIASVFFPFSGWVEPQFNCPSPRMWVRIPALIHKMAGCGGSVLYGIARGCLPPSGSKGRIFIICLPLRK